MIKIKLNDMPEFELKSVILQEVDNSQIMRNQVEKLVKRDGLITTFSKLNWKVLFDNFSKIAFEEIKYDETITNFFKDVNLFYMNNYSNSKKKIFTTQLNCGKWYDLDERMRKIFYDSINPEDKKDLVESWKSYYRNPHKIHTNTYITLKYTFISIIEIKNQFEINIINWNYNFDDFDKYHKLLFESESERKIFLSVYNFIYHHYEKTYVDFYNKMLIESSFVQKINKDFLIRYMYDDEGLDQFGNPIKNNIIKHNIFFDYFLSKKSDNENYWNLDNFYLLIINNFIVIENLLEDFADVPKNKNFSNGTRFFNKKIKVITDAMKIIDNMNNLYDLFTNKATVFFNQFYNLDNPENSSLIDSFGDYFYKNAVKISMNYSLNKFFK